MLVKNKDKVYCQKCKKFISSYKVDDHMLKHKDDEYVSDGGFY